MGKRRQPEKRFNVYVVRPDPEVLEHKRFRRANPDYLDGKPCVYVGMSALSPDERFENHLRGYKLADRTLTGLEQVRAEGRRWRRRSAGW